MYYKDILDLGKNRRTTKNYNADMTVSEADIDKIHEFTNTSPTSFGLEQWRVISISDKEMKKKLEEYFMEFNHRVVSTASHIELFISKKENYFNSDNKELFEIYSNNSRKILETFHKEYDVDVAKKGLDFALSLDNGHNEKNVTEWSVRQAYIGMAFMLLGAESLGVKSTAMEGFKSSINEFLLNENLLHENEHLSIAVALGYDNDVEIPHFGSKQYRIPTNIKFSKI